MKKAFTLAEIMIALTVIGVITSILLPVAFQTTPDENIMKFKKGNATLAKVINELVSSGQYYTPGDLGAKADGTLINGDNDNDYTNFCLNFADVLNTKEVGCAKGTKRTAIPDGSIVCSDWTSEKAKLDEFCKTYKDENTMIKTSDGITFYQTFDFPTFGWDKYDGTNNPKLFKETVAEYSVTLPDSEKINESENAYRCKKVFCMDVDELDSGEEPFGYGIRVDGKIVLGEKAQQWIEKSIQDKD